MKKLFIVLSALLVLSTEANATCQCVWMNGRQQPICDNSYDTPPPGCNGRYNSAPRYNNSY